jgi:hypothetical protein
VTGGSMGGQQQQGPLPPHLPTETDSAFNCAVTAQLNPYQDIPTTTTAISGVSLLSALSMPVSSLPHECIEY